MKFTSTPSNGSSWSESLPFSFDTESTTPCDITLEIASPKESIALRKLYGVTAGTIDIAPYLKHLSWRPPKINSKPTIEQSPSAQRIKVTAEGVSTSTIKLFHSPFDTTTSHAISSTSANRRITRGAPILITLFSTNALQVVIKYITATKTTTSTLTQSSAGMPMDLVVPTATLDNSVTAISIELLSNSTPFAYLKYHIVEECGATKQLMWYNSRGGIETYTFPHSIHTSYSAKVVGDGGNNTSFPAELCEALAHYRLCSAHESPEEIERLSEIIFSPRIFLVSNNTTTPVALDNREILFDSHGTLKQLCLDITETWRGGER